MANPNPSPATRFGAGQPSNHGGKPTASRNALQGSFVRALAEDFDANGKDAIVRCRQEKPDRYLAVIASLMPKELDIKRGLDQLSDDELAAAVERLRSLAAQSGGNSTNPAAAKEQASVVSTLQ